MIIPHYYDDLNAIGFSQNIAGKLPKLPIQGMFTARHAIGKFY